MKTLYNWYFHVAWCLYLLNLCGKSLVQNTCGMLTNVNCLQQTANTVLITFFFFCHIPEKLEITEPVTAYRAHSTSVDCCWKGWTFWGFFELFAVTVLSRTWYGSDLVYRKPTPPQLQNLALHVMIQFPDPVLKGSPQSSHCTQASIKTFEWALLIYIYLFT